MENDIITTDTNLDTNAPEAPITEDAVTANPADLQAELEAARAELAAALEERESARRHCQQKDNEMRALKRKAATDPEALAEYEKELEQERIRTREEGEAAKREYTIKSNSLDVRQMLSEAGVASSDSIKIAEFITSEDLDDSTARAKAIVSVINKVAKDKVKEATNSMLKDNAKEPPNGATAAKETLSPGALAAQRYNQINQKNVGGTT